MSDFRLGEESRIPFETPVWFACIEFKNGEFKNKRIGATKEGVYDLLKFLKEIKSGVIKGQVLAVWPGQHATDLFEINPDKYIPIMELRVKRLEKMKFNELKELEWRERYGIK
jgi:hypothetical protein